MMFGFKQRTIMMGLVSATVLATGLFYVHQTAANAMIVDESKAAITIRGSGVEPNAKISLSTGPKQRLVAQADSNGDFVFTNLIYSSLSALNFSLDIPPQDNGLVSGTSGNHLELLYDPQGSKTRIKGNIGKSGTLAFRLDGSDEAKMQVAGQGGYVSLQTRTGLKLSSGQSQLVASIINVGEVCCPRMIVPSSPITLKISSLPLSAVAPPVPTPKAVVPSSTPKVVVPYIKKEGKEAVPPIEQKDAPPSKPEKKKIPYIVQGSIEIENEIIVDDHFSAAVSFTAADYERTYVGGLKKITDEFRNSIVQHIAALGAMFDARNMMDSLRSLQVSTVETLKNYTPSENICRFGTLSRSLSISEAVVDKNQQAFSKAMFDRNNQQLNTVFSDPGVGVNYMLQDFKKKYCEPVDNNGFLDKYCAVATATSDLLYNRDVDFTRVFDVPLTLDADFTGTATTNTQESLLALFHNLSMTPPYIASEGKSFDPNKNLITTQDARALNGAREVADNSFGALVAEKVKSTNQSTAYMKAVLTQLGVSAPDATQLIGDNPSYFAQMEIMTKKIFQDPAFYANLYDSPANIDRQRVAMKAVELQQGRDFLESLRRREMLLSVLLNLKLRTDAGRTNTSGVTTKQ